MFFWHNVITTNTITVVFTREAELVGLFYVLFRGICVNLVIRLAQLVHTASNFVSRKLEQDLRPKEMKPSVVNLQCVYHISCDLCDADYVGYTI